MAQATPEEIVRIMARHALALGPSSYPAFLEVAGRILSEQGAADALAAAKEGK